jgi:hypothetical protein
MSKGSSPRNIFSNDFRDNYDAINWAKNADANADEYTKECTCGDVSIIEGSIQQTLNVSPDENDCCANE